jgi:hypothetical protein
MILALHLLVPVSHLVMGDNFMIKPKLTAINVSIATIVFLFGAALALGSPEVRGSDSAAEQNNVLHAQSKDQTQVKTFAGMIGKVGEKFILKDDVNKVWYSLDDQLTAG